MRVTYSHQVQRILFTRRYVATQVALRLCILIVVMGVAYVCI